jgi:riboflavin kinase/FMN adenylyltransferase
MKVFNTYKNIPAEFKNHVVAIGNFDGIHLGHQKLLSLAKQKAKELNTKAAILTFEPHPRKLFRPDDPPFRITPPAVKLKQFEKHEIDCVFSINFDWEFASQSPNALIEHVSKKEIEPAHIIVGYDFCFGQLRKGTTETLKQAGLSITAIDKITENTNPENALSSSNVRAALRHGKIEQANKYLGWEWYAEGIIIKGDQRGRELGYPTANVALLETLHPGYGVYAAFVQIVEDGESSAWLPSATNIGIRPMFKIPTAQIEAHILDFDRDIYDHTLRIKPVKKLRGEARFDNIEDLIQQMEKDCDKARNLLAG